MTSISYEDYVLKEMVDKKLLVLIKFLNDVKILVITN